MPLSAKSNHSSSNQHKNKTKQQHIWFEDCGKYTSDKTKQFQSEIHNQHQQSNFDKVHTASRAASYTSPHFGQEVEVIVNEKTYNKLKVNPTENVEHHINELPNKNFPDKNIN